MSGLAVGAVIALEDVSSTEKLVLFVLANYCDQHGCCFPSQDTIAKGTALTDRCVRGALLSLTRKGLLTRQARYHGTGRTSDRIVLTFIPELASATIEEPRSGGSGKSRRSYRKLTTDIPEPRSGEPLREPLREPKQARSIQGLGALTLEEIKAAIAADPLNQANQKALA